MLPFEKKYRMSKLKIEQTGKIDRISNKNKENIIPSNRSNFITLNTQKQSKSNSNSIKNGLKTQTNVFDRLSTAKKCIQTFTKETNTLKKPSLATTRQSLNTNKFEKSNLFIIEEKKNINVNFEKKLQNENFPYKTLVPLSNKNQNRTSLNGFVQWNSLRKLSESTSYEAFQAKLYENILDH